MYDIQSCIHSCNGGTYLCSPRCYKENILFIGSCTPCTLLHHRSKMVLTLISLQVWDLTNEHVSMCLIKTYLFSFHWVMPHKPCRTGRIHGRVMARLTSTVLHHTAKNYCRSPLLGNSDMLLDHPETWTFRVLRVSRLTRSPREIKHCE